MGDNPTVVVYGEVDSRLVFIRAEHALYLSAVRVALEAARTWGDARQIMPRRAFEELVQDAGQTFSEYCADWVDDAPNMQTADAVSKFREALREYEDLGEGERRPLDWEPFTDQDAAQETWPGWPAAMMLEWMPEAAYEYGEIANATLDGPFLQLPPSRSKEIVSVLETEGYRCLAAERLVRFASGDGHRGCTIQDVVADVRWLEEQTYGAASFTLPKSSRVPKQRQQNRQARRQTAENAEKKRASRSFANFMKSVHRQEREPDK